ncbi:hypothetical protein D9757_012123 [Collybiopsis confluens]|uniref:Uncharacterized protein n=1 Tax=Collybiopsis confluens TaxID=2823264 RepID=A0A8H5GIF0_9AGAR|nr:hypothetical protein D9757_012123 [Collybiopsis confluens]
MYFLKSVGHAFQKFGFIGLPQWDVVKSIQLRTHHEPLTSSSHSLTLPVISPASDTNCARRGTNLRGGLPLLAIAVGELEKLLQEDDGDRPRNDQSRCGNPGVHLVFTRWSAQVCAPWTML